MDGKELGKDDGTVLGPKLGASDSVGCVDGIVDGKELGKFDGMVLGTKLGITDLEGGNEG